MWRIIRKNKMKKQWLIFKSIETMRPISINSRERGVCIFNRKNGFIWLIISPNRGPSRFQLCRINYWLDMFTCSAKNSFLGREKSSSFLREIQIPL